MVLGLKKSTWKPIDGSDSLISELKSKGPLFVGGALGKPAYMDAPYERTQKIANRAIYAWRPGAKRHPNSFVGHTVLLVGAKKVEKEAYVYFIDSVDPSDPKDLSKQKIYMISFNNFTNHITDLHGRLRQDSPVPYAYYGNFKIPL
jgi:hypothetical protein